MAEYIDRQAVIDLVDKGFLVSNANYGSVSRIVRQIPAADVQPVKHGRWVWDEDGMDWGLGAWKCSACGTRTDTWWQGDHRLIPMRCSGSKFCGNCGAKMDLEGDE